MHWDTFSEPLELDSRLRPSSVWIILLSDRPCTPWWPKPHFMSIAKTPTSQVNVKILRSPFTEGRRGQSLELNDSALLPSPSVWIGAVSLAQLSCQSYAALISLPVAHAWKKYQQASWFKRLCCSETQSWPFVLPLYDFIDIPNICLSTHGRINTLPSCKLRWCWCLVTPLLPRVIMLSRFHLIIPQCQIGQDDKC